MSTINSNSFEFLALPPNAKLHNLLSLAAKDLAITPSPEEMGASLLVQHQKLMLEHFGHKEMAILPEDIIQHLLLGVSSLILLSRGASPFFLTLYLFILTEIEVITYNSVFVFQSTRTLELALHLESNIIKLKQDALRLMNIVLAGTACG